MKYGQVINITIFFFKNFVENGTERVFPDLFLFFKKALFELNVVVCSLALLYFNGSQVVR